MFPQTIMQFYTCKLTLVWSLRSHRDTLPSLPDFRLSVAKANFDLFSTNFKLVISEMHVISDSTHSRRPDPQV